MATRLDIHSSDSHAWMSERKDAQSNPQRDNTVGGGITMILLYLFSIVRLSLIERVTKTPYMNNSSPNNNHLLGGKKRHDNVMFYGSAGQCEF